MKHIGLKGGLLRAVSQNVATSSVTYGGNIFLFDGSVPSDINNIPFLNNTQQMGELGTRLKALQYNAKGVIAYNTELATTVEANDTINLVNAGTDAQSFNIIFQPRNLPTGQTSFNATTFGGALTSGTMDSSIAVFPMDYWLYEDTSSGPITDNDISINRYTTARRLDPRPGLDGSPELYAYVGGHSYLRANDRYSAMEYRSPITVDRIIIRIHPPSGQNNGHGSGARTMNIQFYYRNEADTAWTSVGTMSYSTGNHTSYIVVPLNAPVTASKFLIRAWSTGSLSEGSSMALHLSDFGLGKAASPQNNSFTPTWALITPYSPSFPTYATDKNSKFSTNVSYYPMILAEVGTGPGKIELNRTTFLSTENIVPKLLNPFPIKVS